MSGRKVTAETIAMRECRDEAERFVNSLPMFSDASKQDKGQAVGKIGRALWEIRQARMKADHEQQSR